MTSVTPALIGSFATSISPVLITFLLGLVFALLKILKPEYTRAFSIYIHYVGLPALVFRRLALNNPASLDLKLLGADALSKFIPLILLLLWWRFFSKLGRVQSLEWVIAFFMLSTLPNTVLIGDSILSPMFGTSIETETTAIIFAQSLYWYNVVIIMMEIRELMLDDEREKMSIPDHAVKMEMTASQDAQNTSSKDEYSHQARVVRTSSAPPAFAMREFSFSKRWKVNPFCQMDPALDSSFQQDRKQTTVFTGGREAEAQPVSADVIDPEQPRGIIQAVNYIKDAHYNDSQEVPLAAQCLARVISAKLIVLRVVKRILRAPLIYGSSSGFIWSLIAFHFHWKLPTFFLSTMGLCGDGVICIAMLLLGMSLGKSILTDKRVVPCGYKVLFAGFAARGIVAPIIMYVSARMFRIKGTLLRYAIVQVVVPQGSMTFALARHYNCRTITMATMVYVQMVVFIPIVLAYYAALQAI